VKFKNLVTQLCKQRMENDLDNSLNTLHFKNRIGHNQIVMCQNRNEKIIERHRLAHEEDNKYFLYPKIHRKRAMKQKIEKEVGIIMQVNHNKSKQAKIQNRIEAELKSQNTKISNYREKIHGKIKSEKWMHKNCKLVTGKESDINSTYALKKNKILTSVFMVEARLKLDTKPDDYKKP
jgi:hypothetical protein